MLLSKLRLHSLLNGRVYPLLCPSLTPASIQLLQTVISKAPELMLFQATFLAPKGEDLILFCKLPSNADAIWLVIVHHPILLRMVVLGHANKDNITLGAGMWIISDATSIPYEGSPHSDPY